MSALREPDALTLEQALEIVREATRDKGYQDFPLGKDAAEYLRIKRKRLTALSYRDYESSLDKFSRAFPVLELADFEPPAGTQRLEEFLDNHWGGAAPNTYNKHLSVLKDFFKHQIIRGRMVGDPTLPIERAKKRQSHRESYSSDQVRSIIVSAESRRDRIALRLLLHYGLRNGTIRAVQFKHFDHQRKRVTLVKIKGGIVRDLPIPDPHFWMDLERLVLDIEAQPDHFLLCKNRGNQHRTILVPAIAMGGNGFKLWWYARLADAGIVPRGTTSGERPHKARHTAGQMIYDRTADLKLVQRVLMHASSNTTANTYLDYDLDQIADRLAAAMRDDDEA